MDKIVISDHSWVGKACHIIRKCKTLQKMSVKRGIIHELVFKDNCFTFRVVFKSNKKLFQQYVDPYFLFYFQESYLKGEVLSDGEDENDFDEDNLDFLVDCPLPMFSLEYEGEMDHIFKKLCNSLNKYLDILVLLKESKNQL
jgi:hypothetical protein